MKSAAYLVALIPAIVMVLYFRRARLKWFTARPDTDTKRPAQATLPTQVKHNDKLVIVKSASDTELKMALTGFCNMYNNQTYRVLPRLIKLSEREFAVTFPCDIDFIAFSFFINYMVYPMELSRQLDVVAWATTASTDAWITDKNANKKVMLYVPAEDTEGDNVYMTTSDNAGYKLGFGIGGRKMIEPPVKRYVPPAIQLSELEGKAFEDFK